MKADTLDLMLDDLLRACETAYETVNDAPPAPDRFIKVHGTPVWDGPQLAVACSAIRPFISAANRCLVLPIADLVVEIVRDGWPDAQTDIDGGTHPPIFGDLHAATALLLGDAITLYTHLASVALTGDLFPSIAGRVPAGHIRCGDVTFNPMVPLEPSGGMAGWRTVLAVKLAIP